MHHRAWVSIVNLLWVAAAICSVQVSHAVDLEGVYRDALTNDPTFQQAYANMRASREARPEAWAALLPQISGSGGRTADHSSGFQSNITALQSGALFPFTIQNTGNATTDQWRLDLRDSLFSWANWMGIRAADRQVAEAQATYQAAAQDLILRTAVAYFNVLSAVDTLQAQESSLAAYSEQLEQTKARYKAGLIGIIDVEQSQAARDSTAAAVVVAKQTLASADDALRAITGREYEVLAEPAADMTLAMPEPADQERWVRTSLQSNLALIASRLAADVARENVLGAFGGHVPTVSIVASRSYTRTNATEDAFGQTFALPNKINDRQIELEVSVPIFSGGATQAQVHQAEYQWIAAKDAMHEVARSTEQQARDAYTGVISGIGNVQARRQALTSSETAYKATEAGYRAGTQSEVDVLTALNTLVQAQTNYATSRYSYITSAMQLSFAAGTLDRNAISAVNRWLTVNESVSGIGAAMPLIRR